MCVCVCVCVCVSVHMCVSVCIYDIILDAAKVGPSIIRDRILKLTCHIHSIKQVLIRACKFNRTTTSCTLLTRNSEPVRVTRTRGSHATSRKSRP